MHVENINKELGFMKSILILVLYMYILLLSIQRRCVSITIIHLKATWQLNHVGPSKLGISY